MAPAYGGKSVKIQITKTERLRAVIDVIFQAFQSQGGVEKYKLAPEGGLERELQAVLDEL